MFGFSGSKIDLEEKIFLFTYNSPGCTADNIVSKMKHFFPKEDEKKLRKRVMTCLKELVKRNLVYILDERDWDMSVTSRFYMASSEEAADYYNRVCRKYSSDAE